jgi:hypothetical protein
MRGPPLVVERGLRISLARAVSGSPASFRTSTSAIAPREVPTNGWSLSEGMNRSRPTRGLIATARWG